MSNIVIEIIKKEVTITPQGAIKGVKGDTGKGITSIVKTNTAGLVDTCTITFTDGTTTMFNITNGEQGIQGETGLTGETGNGIASVVKTNTVGAVDTYAKTFK